MNWFKNAEGGGLTKEFCKHATLFSFFVLILALALCALAVGFLRPAHNLPAIINEWSPRVAMVTCEFLNADGSDTMLARSGILVHDSSGNPHVLTTADAVEHNGNTLLACHIDITGISTIDIGPGGFVISSDGDIADLQIPADTVGLPRASNLRRCAANEPDAGDSVVVLGYPYSATTPIAATDGIIAGLSSAGDRYLTTAYLTAGSFGGVAIDVPHDCYLGMSQVLLAADSSPGPGEILKWQQFAQEL